MGGGLGAALASFLTQWPGSIQRYLPEQPMQSVVSNPAARMGAHKHLLIKTPSLMAQMKDEKQLRRAASSRPSPSSVQSVAHAA